MKILWDVLVFEEGIKLREIVSHSVVDVEKIERSIVSHLLFVFLKFFEKYKIKSLHFPLLSPFLQKLENYSSFFHPFSILKRRIEICIQKKKECGDDPLPFSSYFCSPLTFPFLSTSSNTSTSSTSSNTSTTSTPLNSSNTSTPLNSPNTSTSSTTSTPLNSSNTSTSSTTSTSSNSTTCSTSNSSTSSTSSSCSTSNSSTCFSFYLSAYENEKTSKINFALSQLEKIYFFLGKEKKGIPPIIWEKIFEITNLLFSSLILLSSKSLEEERLFSSFLRNESSPILENKNKQIVTQTKKTTKKPIYTKITFLINQLFSNLFSSSKQSKKNFLFLKKFEKTNQTLFENFQKLLQSQFNPNNLSNF